MICGLVYLGMSYDVASRCCAVRHRAIRGGRARVLACALRHRTPLVRHEADELVLLTGRVHLGVAGVTRFPVPSPHCIDAVIPVHRHRLAITRRVADPVTQYTVWAAAKARQGLDGKGPVSGKRGCETVPDASYLFGMTTCPHRL